MPTAQWIIDARKAKARNEKMSAPMSRKERKAKERSMSSKPKQRKHGRSV